MNPIQIDMTGNAVWVVVEGEPVRLDNLRADGMDRRYVRIARALLVESMSVLDDIEARA